MKLPRVSSIVVVIIILGGLFLFLGTFITCKVWKSALDIYDRNTLSNAEGIKYGLENGTLDQNIVDMDKEEYRVPSPFGYEIAVFFIPGKGGSGESRKTVLFSHGVGSNRWGMMKYAPVFIRGGWNIAAMDHRKHGDSGGESISYGVFEKEDMRVVVDAVLNRFPDSEVFGVFGESMGSAIALQYVPGDPRVDFLVVDCPFDNFYDELLHRSKDVRLPAFLRDGILNLAVRLVRKRVGYDVRAIRPGKDILSSGIPVLFNHGDGDDYVPTAMSIRMYEARKDRAPTDLNLYPGSDHARSIVDHRQAYEENLKKWFSARLDIDL